MRLPCPVNSRTVVDLATLAVSLNSNQSEIQVNTTLTCDKIYTFNKKIFVGYGVTLTIEPGTVLKGVFTNDPVQASCLIVERGGKIIADGTPRELAFDEYKHTVKLIVKSPEKNGNIDVHSLHQQLSQVVLQKNLELVELNSNSGELEEFFRRITKANYQEVN